MINFEKLIEVSYALLPRHRGELRAFHVSGIYKGSKLISLGWNKDVTHPATIEYNYYKGAHSHSELMSILRGGKEDYSRHTICVLRIDRNNKLAQSKPCKCCANVIKQLNFKKVYHTNSLGEWENY